MKVTGLKRAPRQPECHPKRPYYAKGLCGICYQRQHRKTFVPTVRAICHPERAHKCRGLCNACYQAFKLTPEFKPTGRAIAANLCGHPEKRHAGKGMCAACLTRSRRDTDREADRIGRKNYQLRVTYGITLADFEAMYAAQGYACALCRKAIPSERQRQVDHCHQTGAIRGILCFTCNKGLGMLGDSAEGIARALEYLTVERIAAKAGVFVSREAA